MLRQVCECHIAKLDFPRFPDVVDFPRFLPITAGSQTLSPILEKECLILCCDVHDAVSCGLDQSSLSPEIVAKLDTLSLVPTK